MFTGIVTGIGRIVELHDLGTSPLFGKRLAVSCPPGYLTDVSSGDSVALNGACMTATSVKASEDRFYVEVSAESLRCTSGLDAPGAVNLEKALRAQERLGGHIVSGHVDGVGVVSRFEQVGESWLLCILAPQSLAKYLAVKGSVAVNGVSLTINEVHDGAESPMGTDSVRADPSIPQDRVHPRGASKPQAPFDTSGRTGEDAPFDASWRTGEDAPFDASGRTGGDAPFDASGRTGGDVPFDASGRTGGGSACEIGINLIAHTLQHTTLGGLAVGSKVNLEIDLIARYVERMLPFMGGAATHFRLDSGLRRNDEPLVRSRA